MSFGVPRSPRVHWLPVTDCPPQSPHFAVHPKPSPNTTHYLKKPTQKNPKTVNRIKSPRFGPHAGSLSKSAYLISFFS